ncbi:MAG: lytic transglycosylase [Xanthobacteraceae bacterium]|nr:lytic transglycosylase [Xanthobacteraceae bacterium]
MRADAVSTATPAHNVAGAIRQAAGATGTSFDYLLATAQVESGLNPTASASTSSAKGLFQFIDQTWLGTIKDAGASLGYGAYADAITKTPSGRFEVSDPALKSEILNLRHDPTANAAMAGAFTKHNGEVLSERLGRAPSEGELYMAHFLGPGGASKLIALAESSPNATAAAAFPSAAASNRPIFYDKQGGARSVSQVYGVLNGRYDVARAAPPAGVSQTAAFSVPSATKAIATAAPVTVPDTAALTSAYADASPIPVPMTRFADGGPVFHGLFRDDGPRGAVSPVVAGLWGGPAAANGVTAIPDVSAPRATPVVAAPATPDVEASVAPAAEAPMTASGISAGGAMPSFTSFIAPSFAPATSAKPAAKDAANDSGLDMLNDLARRLRSLFGG